MEMLAAIIFVLMYVLIVSEKVHRTIVAMMGAILMIIVGIMPVDTALHHIDFNTLGLLIGMMILVSITAKTGLFDYVAIKTAKAAKAQPRRLLIYLGFITALFSAFLDNVTTVLLMVPVTFAITTKLHIPVVPFLLTQILASNVGGTATLIGDPPNIMIGSAVKELTFVAFIENLTHSFTHIESSVVALFGAFLLLLLAGGSQHDVDFSMRKVEWATIFFFIGLFVAVGGLSETGVIRDLATGAVALTEGDVTKTSLLVLWLSALVSSVLDNIPFVATMIPLIQNMGAMGVDNLEPVWWSLSLGACLGGNGTLVGASANLIVAGMAADRGVKISFMNYFKISFPIMIMTIAISTVYVYLRYLL